MFENIYTLAEQVLNNQKTALTNSLKAIFHPTSVGYLQLFKLSKYPPIKGSLDQGSVHIEQGGLDPSVLTKLYHVVLVDSIKKQPPPGEVGSGLPVKSFL